jgi:diaminopimelate decarboxylase
MTALKDLPLNPQQLTELARRYPTPFYLYTEKEMLQNASRLLKAFEWNKGFTQFFAVKALPNPVVMKLLAHVGLGMDCSSIAELELSSSIGVAGERIMFTSNNTPAPEYHRARELGAVINLDDLTQVSYLKEHVGIPELISFRLNPGRKLAGTDSQLRLSLA